MSTLDITKEMELRHLPTMHQLQLTKLLDVDESVLSLVMGNIVKDLEDSESQLRFNSTDIDSLREHSVRHNKSSIFVLLEEWSSMGRSRPKMKHLLDLLIKCQLYHAADFVADLINEDHPIRPQSGPAAKVNISLENENIEQVVNGLNYPFSSINLTRINRINYDKPALNTPNMNFVNEVSLNANHQPAAAEQSDLIKFSKSYSTQIPIVVHDSENTTNSNSMAIPITVNSSDNIPANESSNFIPAISGLINGNSEESGRIIPSTSNPQSDVPDFSGLMSYGSEQQYSSSSSSSSASSEEQSSTISRL